MRHFASWAALLSLMVLFTVAGCRNTKADKKSFSFNPDEGGNMATAQGLFFNMNIDDRLNTELGDDVDWRYILVTEPGKLSVRLNVDNPYMMGNWYVRDGLGRVLHTERLDPRENFYEVLDIPVEPGRYFFHFEAIKGSSIYTVQSSFQERKRSIKDVRVAQNDTRRHKIEPKEPKRIIIKRKKPRKRRKAKVKKPKPIATQVSVAKVVYPGDVLLADQVNKNQIGVQIRMDRKVPEDLDVTGKNIRTIVTKVKGSLRGTPLSLKITECSQSVCYGEIRSSSRTLQASNVKTGDIRIRIEVH